MSEIDDLKKRISELEDKVARLCADIEGAENTVVSVASTAASNAIAEQISGALRMSREGQSI